MGAIVWEKTSCGYGVPRLFHVGLSLTGLVTRSARGRSVSACMRVSVCPCLAGSGTVSRPDVTAGVCRSVRGSARRGATSSLAYRAYWPPPTMPVKGGPQVEEVSLRGGDSGETQPAHEAWLDEAARWNRGAPPV